MVLAIANRVKERTQTTGTGTLDLDGAEPAFQTFVAGIGNGNTCHYLIIDGITSWEVGVGTVTDASPNTLSRDTVIASSNADALVDWGAGIKTVLVTLPGDQSRGRDALDAQPDWEVITSGTVSNAPTLDLIGLTSTYRAYMLVFDDLLPIDATPPELWVRTSNDNGSTFDSAGSDYGHARIGGAGSTVTGVGSNADSEIEIASGCGNSAVSGEEIAGYIMVHPHGSAPTSVTWQLTRLNNSGNHQTDSGGGRRVSAQADNAFQVLFSAGNISTMNYTLYGMRAA